MRPLGRRCVGARSCGGEAGVWSRALAVTRPPAPEAGPTSAPLRPAVGQRASSRVGRVAEAPEARGAQSSPKREAPGPCEFRKVLEL